LLRQPGHFPLSKNSAATTLAEAAGSSAIRPNRLQPFGSIGMITGLSIVTIIVLVWPKVVQIWTTGVFDDPDDAMRLVEVRDWLAGQPWFDMIAHRLDPSAGTLMHWSRTVDVLLAAMIKILSLGLPIESAERLTRIIAPLALLAGSLASIAYLARLLVGPLAMAPAVAMIVLSGIVFGQFAPGSIHHHAIQICLLVAIVATMLTAFDPSRAKLATITGLAIAASLSVGLEDLPYIVVAAAMFPLVWIVDKDGARLGYFAGGLAAGLLVAFAATTRPARYLVASCDAFSIAHLIAGLADCVICVVLQSLSSRIERWPLRLAISAVGGGAVLIVLAATYPACLGDPLAQIDPFTRAIWLANVQEARPLLTVLRQWPSLFPMLLLPPILATLGSLTAALAERGLAQRRWLALNLFLLAGWATALWQIRGLAAVSVLAVIGGSWIVVTGLRRWPTAVTADGLLVSLFLSLPFCAIAWAVIVPPAANAEQEGRAAGTQACQEPSNFEPLNRLPTGLILAPVNSGSHLLAYTAHSVLAAPYHRNGAGNRLVMQVFLARPEAAHAAALSSGATYLAFCPQLPQMQIFAQLAPDGLAAALLRAEIPEWLEKIELSGSRYQVFRIGPNGAPASTPLERIRLPQRQEISTKH
jgi:hypothetical protein